MNKNNIDNILKGISQFLHKDKGVDQFLKQFNIQEPTRSLLWTTNSDPSKARHLGQYIIKIRFSVDRHEEKDPEDKYNLYSEPSLIWTKMPIKRNKFLEERKMYYPAYSELSPENRWQYLSWLQNIEKDTNPSYAFLYYYGLERHLLIGDFDNAVREVIKLFKHFKKINYLGGIINSLINISMYRGRKDIVKTSPYLMNEITDWSLYLRALAGKSLKVEDLLSLYNSRAYYRNHFYTKCLESYPDLFIKELEKSLNEYQSKNGNILEKFQNSKLERVGQRIFYNLSLTDKATIMSQPNILNNKDFEAIFRGLFSKTYKNIKKLKGF